MSSGRRPLATIVAFLALTSCAAVGATPANAAATPAASPHQVKLPFSLDPGFRLSPSSTTIHVKLVQRGCGPIYERSLIHRSTRRLTITLLSAPWSPPLPGVACPDYIAIRPLAVRIGPRPLDRRAIYDGAFSPPREVYPG